MKNQDGGGIKMSARRPDTQQPHEAAGRVHSVACGCTLLALGDPERCSRLVLGLRAS